MDYLLVKWLHILSSTVLFGAGLGSAFHMLLAVLGRDPKDVAATSRHVVVQDWLLTAPTAVIQPLTGWWMVQQAGLPLATPWVRHSFELYAFAIACWLPVVWIQYRLRDLARQAADAGGPLPRAWWRWFAAWFALGVLAFAAFLWIFWLMVSKPA